MAQAIDYTIQKVLPAHIKKERNQLTQLHWWKEILGHYSLAEITPPLLAEKRDKLLAEKTKRKKLCTPATVNRYLATLSHVFTIATKEWQWIEENPLLKITKPTEPRSRVRFFIG